MASSSPSPMALNFKVAGRNGTTFALSVLPQMSVGEVKGIAREKCGIEVKHMKMVYRSRILPDGEAIERLGLQPGCTVHVVRSAAGDAAAAAATVSGGSPLAVPLVPASWQAQAGSASPSQVHSSTSPSHMVTPSRRGRRGGSGGGAAQTPAPMTPGGLRTPAQRLPASPTGLLEAKAESLFDAETLRLARGMLGEPNPGSQAAISDRFDPTTIQHMLQKPAIKQMMGGVTQDPQILRSVILDNRQLQLAVQGDPAVAQLLGSEDVMQAMLNPEVLHALMQLELELAAVPQGRDAVVAGAAASLDHRLMEAAKKALVLEVGAAPC